MEYSEAIKIRESWGDKPCDHPYLEKMYYTGAFLTVYVCRQCGAEISIAAKLERDLQQKASKKSAG
ncbi:MAG TPA: hypothetical protein VMT63_03590 [Bacteroidales bacterium]|nr:hypothetical protein [Bacteroidales bacterium]